jgi:hypothetical protein
MAFSYAGQSKCGNWIQSKCGARGRGAPINLAGSLLGVGSLKGSLNSQVLTPYINDIFTGFQKPPGTWVSGPTLGSGYTLEYEYGAAEWKTSRMIFGFNVPSGHTYQAANIILNNQNYRETVTENFNMLLYANPTCSHPPVASDCFDIGTTGTQLVFDGQILAASLPPMYTIWTVPLPLGLLTAGAVNYFAMIIDLDLDEISSSGQVLWQIYPELALAW